MKLFTINATPVQVKYNKATNDFRVKTYRDGVASVLKDNGFDGFTITETLWYWQGKSEVSFEIKIAVDKDPERVYTVCKTLRDTWEQDSVMLTLPNNSVKFI